MLQESWTTLQPSNNINVSSSVKSQQEPVSINCHVSVGVALLCQLLDEFAAVEAAVEVSPQ